jgi:hypothetical protein
VETPEPPREGTAGRLGQAAEERGLSAATWAGGGDRERGFAVLALAAAAGSFVCLFMPWLGFAGRTQSGWNVPLARDYGLLALAVIVVELLALARAWKSRGSELVAFCLVGGAGLLGVSAVVDLRWGGLTGGGFSLFEYGAWLGLVFSLVLLALGALRLAVLWRSAP